MITEPTPVPTATRSPISSAVLITGTEPEPRTFGKQVVLGGLLDHLCARLGADRVQVLLIGRERDRPRTPYRLRLLRAPSAGEQLRAVATRVLPPPHSPLQEAAFWSPWLRDEIRRAFDEIGADLEIWDTMRTGQYARALPRHRIPPGGRPPGPPAAARTALEGQASGEAAVSPARRRARILYADDLFSKRYATMLHRMRTDPAPMGNPLGEVGKMLPGIAQAVVARPFVHRPLLRLERRLTARSEERAPADFDATILVNPQETAELTQRSGSTTVRTLLPLLPPAVGRPRQFDGSPTFVFLGSLGFPPNRDGLTWFLRECRGEVLAAVPDFQLLLIGRGTNQPPAEAAAWGHHVRPLGWVDELDDVLLSAAALLSPLRTGSGIKIKVLEALSRGLPVVATRQGVLGLEVGVEDGCLVADTPEGLARCLVAATDPVRNRELSAAAAASWQRSYAPEVVASAYDEVLGLTPESPPGTTQPLSAPGVGGAQRGDRGRERGPRTMTGDRGRERGPGEDRGEGRQPGFGATTS
jgi:polysaccharide biosynthesis protein PslH